MKLEQPLSVTAAAETRRAIRKYTGEEISRADIEEILRVAGLAPSAWNVQPWRVKVVTRQADKDALMAAAYGQPQVGAAAAVFVVYSDMADTLEQVEDTIHPGMADRIAAESEARRSMFAQFPEDAREHWGNSQSSIFLGFLLLAIASQGYASSPMLGFDQGKVKELYGLPAHVKFPGIVAVGVAAEEGFTHHRHPLARFVEFV